MFLTACVPVLSTAYNDPRVLCDGPLYAVGTSSALKIVIPSILIRSEHPVETAHIHTNPDPRLRHSNTFHLLISDQDSLELPPKKDPKI